MSCLDVMYQSYGAHYIPASQVAAAAAYKAACYRHQQPPLHHHHHQQHQQHQQQKPGGCSKMQECVEQQQQQHCPGGSRQQRGGMLPREQDLPRTSGAPATGSGGGPASDLTSKDGSQPAEAEYLSSRCVLFTYFQGDIGDVVDEHFSRALSQPGIFSGETKPIRVTQSPASAASGLWKDGAPPPEGQCSSLSSPAWNSAYPSQASPCLPSVSVSIRPDFSPSPVPFHSADGALWAGHPISQAGLQPPAPLPDTWTYSLSPQSTGGYTHIHDVYSHPHTHVHARHPHTVIHSYPAHSPALDPRFSSLLLPGVRSHSQPVLSPRSHGEGKKAAIDPSTSSAAWPTSAPEVYDSAVDPEKVKASGWF
ncbi:transcription cofactor vestigial-like protein 3 isoform X2 [Lampris incognitus]|uniref:transcription cofactor vestigial-like protein 3 isoform X2 n=1 Tax=Lampris incognitus TaxID=2546036 RepID=UPI0024B4E9CF|nr:transcription cofactor vestigial-like protein 3 isoform X2 [Lampris incognitus]